MPGNVETEGLAELGPDYRAQDGGLDPAGQARHRRPTSETRRCSWPPTRPATSPARRSSSTAARPCLSRSMALEANEYPVADPTEARATCRRRSAPPRSRCATACGAQIAAGELVPGQRLGAERETGRAPRRLARRRCAPHWPIWSAAARSAARAGAAAGSSSPSARSSAISPAWPACPPTCAARAFSPTPGSSRLPPTTADDEIAAALGLARGRRSCTRSSACAWPTASRSRSSARRFPAERVSRPARSLAVRARSTNCWQSDYGLVPGEAEERIEVVRPPAPRGAAARPGPRRAAGGDRAHGVDAEGVAFEHSHDLFRGDRVRIVVRARPAPETASVVAASVEVL